MFAVLLVPVASAGVTCCGSMRGPVWAAGLLDELVEVEVLVSLSDVLLLVLDGGESLGSLSGAGMSGAGCWLVGTAAVGWCWLLARVAEGSSGAVVTLVCWLARSPHCCANVAVADAKASPKNACRSASCAVAGM